jgi:Tol biopolymer transport system component
MLALSGSAFPIAGDVSVAPTVRSAPVSAAFDGPIVFRSGTEAGKRQFEWVDRNGSDIAKLGESIAEALSPSLSPDETSVVFHRLVSVNIDLWRLDTARGVVERLTTDPISDLGPIWSPDGVRIAYASSDLKVRSLRGGEPEVLLQRSERFPFLSTEDWSSDGRFLIFNSGPRAQRIDDMWVLPLDPPGDPTPFAVSAALEGDGQFSPDGQWIAYTSDESGRPEIYAARSRDPAVKLRISTTGGGMARWSRDGASSSTSGSTGD